MLGCRAHLDTTAALAETEETAFLDQNEKKEIQVCAFLFVVSCSNAKMRSCSAGVGAQGPPGKIGPAGPAGAVGPKGQKGSPGPQGKINTF